jgi:hypothetical protein
VIQTNLEPALLSTISIVSSSCVRPRQEVSRFAMATTTTERMIMNDATVAVVIIKSMVLMVCGYNVHGMNQRGAVVRSDENVVGGSRMEKNDGVDEGIFTV